MVTTEKYLPGALLADGDRCFPDREYSAVCFGYPTPVTEHRKDPAFMAEAGRHARLYPLRLAGRTFGLSSSEYSETLIEGNFFGFKILLDWLGDDYGDVTIEDMAGPEEMIPAHDMKLPVMLHVPRSGRLADPVVQEGVRRLSKEYPDASIVLAHCGRCYLPSEMSRAAGSVEDLPNVYMDTSMVMDAVTIQIAMEHLGPGRLLFGTDFPVAAMRGRRVRVMDHWVDVVLDEYPDSAFRVKSSGIRASFMAWEIVIAIRDAAARAGISARELHGVFYDNGMRLLKRVRNGAALKNKSTMKENGQ